MTCAVAARRLDGLTLFPRRSPKAPTCRTRSASLQPGVLGLQLLEPPRTPAPNRSVPRSLCTTCSGLPASLHLSAATWALWAIDTYWLAQSGGDVKLDRSGSHRITSRTGSGDRGADRTDSIMSRPSLVRFNTSSSRETCSRSTCHTAPTFTPLPI